MGERRDANRWNTGSAEEAAVVAAAVAVAVAVAPAPPPAPVVEAAEAMVRTVKHQPVKEQQ